MGPGHGRTDLGARLDSLAARRAAERLLNLTPESIRLCVVLGGVAGQFREQHLVIPTWRLRGLEMRLDALSWTTPEALEQTSPPTPQDPPELAPARSMSYRIARETI